MNRNDFVKEAKKREGKTGRYLFDKYKVETHWCMMQIYDLMHDFAKIEDFPHTYSVSDFKRTSFAKPRINHDYKTGEIGDLILFENNGCRADGPDHIGVIVENTGKTLKILEGNTAGNSYLFYDTSTSNIWEYSYEESEFDCIIDMSDFFTDEVEEVEEDTSENEPASDNKEVILKVRQLRKGMTGGDVKSLQRLLFADGYSVGKSGDDGDFGNDTEKAVINYQKDHELDPDGIAGEKTLTALWNCERLSRKSKKENK